MFTGIIQGLGYISNIDKEKNIYTIKTAIDLKNVKIGSSICCDGVCLTIVKIFNDEDDNNFFSVNIGEETIKRSNLINLHMDSRVNLEKSLRVGDELSGHFVYGHVDSVLRVSKIQQLNNSWEFEFSLLDTKNLSKINKLIVEKGSVAINGISLTIANVTNDAFTASIIPHTYTNTNLSFLKYDDIVNIEFDPLARYIQNKYDN